MDTVITCVCGNQSWVLGTSGCRCNSCGFWIRKEWLEHLKYDVDTVNRKIDELKEEAQKHLHQKYDEDNNKYSLDDLLID